MWLSLPKLIPQVFNAAEVKTGGRPFHPLHSQILEVVSEKTRSVGASIIIFGDSVRSQKGDMGWPLVAESHLNISFTSHYLHQKILLYQLPTDHCTTAHAHRRWQHLGTPLEAQNKNQ